MSKHNIYNAPTSNLEHQNFQPGSVATIEGIISTWWAFMWRASLFIFAMSLVIIAILVTIENSMSIDTDSAVDIMVPYYLILAPSLASFGSLYWMLKKTYGKYRLVLIEN